MMTFPKWLPWHFGAFLSLSPEIFPKTFVAFPAKLLNLGLRLLGAYVIATGNVMNY